MVLQRGPFTSPVPRRRFFPIRENMLICNADDSTFIDIVPSPGVRVAVAVSLNRDLGNVSERCDLWGMKLCASKTKTMTVWRSHTMYFLKGISINDLGT